MKTREAELEAEVDRWLSAAEAAVGLGILIAFFRNRETVNVDEVDLMKW